MKGLFLAEREGHPPPRIVETPAGMLNAIGLQGIGVHRFIAEKMPELRARGAVVIVNICGTTLQEYVELATILSDVEGVAALELNISCPNIKEGGITFGCSLHGTAEVVAAVRAVTPLPVIPKLTPNVTDISAIAKAAEDAGADAVSLVNTFLAMAIDVETRRPQAVEYRRRPQRPRDSPDRGADGLRVPAEDPHPDHRHGRHRDGRDALEFIIAGASAVQVGTANFADPLIWPKLLDGLSSMASVTTSRPSPISSAPSTQAHAKKNGSAPSRARRGQCRARHRAGDAASRPRRRPQDRQPPVYRGRSAAGAPARRRRATASFSI